jgi:hypothetical protein
MAASLNPSVNERWARTRNTTKWRIAATRTHLENMAKNPILAPAERDQAMAISKQITKLLSNWHIYNDYSQRQYVLAWRREQQEKETEI